MVAKSVKKYFPAADQVASHPMLKWLGPMLTRPTLWHFNRRSIALGLAIGVFWGLLIPLAQIPFAAVMAILLRANLPVVVASTLVTNPFTFAPVYFLAYQVGLGVLGVESGEVSEDVLAEQVQQISLTSTDWISRIAEIGAPLFTGLFIFAFVGSILCYVTILLVWRVIVVWKQRKRRRLRS